MLSRYRKLWIETVVLQHYGALVVRFSDQRGREARAEALHGHAEANMAVWLRACAKFSVTEEHIDYGCRFGREVVNRWLALDPNQPKSE